MHEIKVEAKYPQGARVFIVEAAHVVEGIIVHRRVNEGPGRNAGGKYEPPETPGPWICYTVETADGRFHDRKEHRLFDSIEDAVAASKGVVYVPRQGRGD